MKHYPIEQHRAWKRMLEKRTCPPLDLLEKGGKDIEAHLHACESCRSKLDYIPAMKELGGCLPENTPTPEDLVGHPGEVRLLLRKAAKGDLRDSYGWENPPMVVLLSEIPGAKGMFRVAQIHDAPELAASGDKALDGDMEGCFAESWNTYPAFIDCMTAPLAEISGKLVEQLVSDSKRPRYVPEGGSVLFSFRSQELRTGGFFGGFAAARGVQLGEEAYEAQKRSRVPLARWTSSDASSYISKHMVAFAKSHMWTNSPHTTGRPFPFSFGASMAGAALCAGNSSFSAVGLLSSLFAGKKQKEEKREGYIQATAAVVSSLESKPSGIYEVLFSLTYSEEGQVHLKGECQEIKESYSFVRVFTASGDEVKVLSSKIGNGKLSLSLLCQERDIKVAGPLFLLLEELGSDC